MRDTFLATTYQANFNRYPNPGIAFSGVTRPQQIEAGPRTSLGEVCCHQDTPSTI